MGVPLRRARCGTCAEECWNESSGININGSPHRLDLAAERARRAVAAGCLLAIDSDAHRTEELDYLRWGVDQARRAWVEPGQVLNTRPLPELLAWVAAKPSRV